MAITLGPNDFTGATVLSGMRKTSTFFSRARHFGRYGREFDVLAKSDDWRVWPEHQGPEPTLSPTGQQFADVQLRFWGDFGGQREK